MNISRRSFVGLGMCSLADCVVGAPALTAGRPRGRSWYNGVEIGCITYSYRSMPCDAASVVKYAVDSGLGTIELMGNVVDDFVGSGEKRDMSKLPVLKKMFDDAGVSIHIVKYGAIGCGNHKEDAYRVAAAKALGARCITREVPKPANYESEGRSCAAIADKNDIFIAFHNHMQIDALTYDGPLLGYSPNLMVNFDIGHYVAATTDDKTRFIDPIDFVEKYYDRIFSIHLKDRTTKAHGSKNLEFGKGDTPLARLCPYLQRKSRPMYCDIELEYKIPAGSNAVKEVARCHDYCRARCGV